MLRLDDQYKEPMVNTEIIWLANLVRYLTYLPFSKLMSSHSKIGTLLLVPEEGFRH